MVNVFVSSYNPKMAAANLPDLLTQRMALEAAEILCGVHLNIQLGDKPTPGSSKDRAPYDNYDWEYEPPPYRRSISQRKHPHVTWAGEDPRHYIWLLNHFRSLNNEYAAEYNDGESCTAFTTCYDYLKRNMHRVKDNGKYWDCIPRKASQLEFYWGFTHKEFLPYAKDVTEAYKISLMHKLLYLYKRKHTWGSERVQPTFMFNMDHRKLLYRLYGEPVNEFTGILDERGRYFVSPKG